MRLFLCPVVVAIVHRALDSDTGSATHDIIQYSNLRAGGGGASLGSRCPKCGKAETIGTSHQGFPEVSGLGLSVVKPGVFYFINDSPPANGPHLGVLHPDSGIVNITLSGIVPSPHAFGRTDAGDWEALSVGPCGQAKEAGSCVYIGDIGHNYARVNCSHYRNYYGLIRIEETELLKENIGNVSYERFWFQYPDGHHDTETLMVHPLTGSIYVVTKANGGEAVVFKVPHAGHAAEVTGGDFSPDGKQIYLRGYKTESMSESVVYRFTLDGSEDSDIKNALTHQPCRLPAPNEYKGEGLVVSENNDGYYTAAENGGGQLHYVKCSVGGAVFLACLSLLFYDLVS